MAAPDTTRVKREKGEFWAREGAATVYEKNVSSSSPFIQIKNHVERTLVGAHASGRILDAGTGTGRFAIPLAQVAGNSVVAMDYSSDMLHVNRAQSARLGLRDIEYVRGDIEHLPFPADDFDTVVSITVVRHFPQWKAILREYVRVLKPGGKLVFEMCSGDHIAAANRVWPRFGAAHAAGGFLSYEAEVTQAALREWLDAIGVDVIQTTTYDYLNSNAFLRIVTLGDLGYRVALKSFKTILAVPALRRAMAWLELHALGKLPPAFAYNYMVVGRKR